MHNHIKPMKDRLLSIFGFPPPTQLNRLNNPWGSAYSSNDNSLVVDMRKVDCHESLKEQIFNLRNELKKLRPNAKVLLIGLSEKECSGKTSLLQRALVGFTKSLAKEIGRSAKTVSLIRIPNGLDLADIPLIVSFFTSGRSAFITGQVLSVEGSGSDGSLKGKVCLVTGGAGGIGLATVKRLAAESAQVIIVDLPSMKDSISSFVSDNISFIGADLTNAEDLKSLVNQIGQQYGKVDVLANNAGITRDRTLSKMSEKEWDQLIAVNLMAVVGLTDSLLSNDLISRGGSIINTSSISGIAGNFGQTNYTATKAALIEMAKVYSEDLREMHISVNAIAPGYIETDMVKTMPLMTRIMAERITCLAQAGRPEDIAEAMAFFAHPASRGVNGQVLRVCGGSFLGA